MLEQILQTKQDEIAQLNAAENIFPVHVKEREIPFYPFVQRLHKPYRRTALIAEVKKASPSKGVIREDFDPVHIARKYAQAGADCLSVLTDAHYFQGDPAYIAQIKAEVKLPVLRKDFIIDPVQVRQSVQLGADAILLIARAVADEQLHELYDLAQSCGLDVLVEVADASEIKRVFSIIQPTLIGINNRDLRTFETSYHNTLRLMPLIPEDVLVISESGIHDAQTIRELEKHGVGGFLIGEHLMRQDDPVQAVEKLYE